MTGPIVFSLSALSTIGIVFGLYFLAKAKKSARENRAPAEPAKDGAKNKAKDAKKEKSQADRISDQVWSLTLAGLAIILVVMAGFGVTYFVKALWLAEHEVQATGESHKEVQAVYCPEWTKVEDINWNDVPPVTVPPSSWTHISHSPGLVVFNKYWKEPILAGVKDYPRIPDGRLKLVSLKGPMTVVIDYGSGKNPYP